MSSYRESLDWLYGLQLHGIQLGLESVARLCTALEVPLKSSDECRFIHVAGTNGKGSTCAMIAAILSASGQRTGLYTSPHLASFRERIRLGTNLIPEDHIIEGVAEIRGAIADWETPPTFFEVTTVLALAWFKKQRARWVVLETGLGGRLDATNIITPSASVITPIGMDHMQWLGSTLSEIAREKAGILKHGIPAISAPQPPEAQAALRETATTVGAPLTFIQKPLPENRELALTGPHQRMNAAVAFAAVIAAGMRPEPTCVGEALRTIQWPGRFQRIAESRIILDGAHNAHAAAALVATWHEQFPNENPVLIFGACADKDTAALCATLAPLPCRIICVPLQNPRSATPADLARQFDHPHVSTAESPAAALAAEPTARLLITGSLFLVGEILVHLRLAQADGHTTSQ